jgi:hypothetical protein
LKEKTEDSARPIKGATAAERSSAAAEWTIAQDSFCRPAQKIRQHWSDRGRSFALLTCNIPICRVAIAARSEKKLKYLANSLFHT